jgi:hypothetical protein
MQQTHKAVLCIALLVLILGTAHVLLHATESSWGSQRVESDRIILHYPAIMPEENAKAFLKDRGKALQFVEDFLQVKLEMPLTIHIHATLIASSGRALYSPQPTIEYNLPVNRLQRKPILSEDGTPVHEIVHIVADHEWSPILSLALGEGMAVALDFISRPSGMVDPHLFTKGLMLMDALMPLDELFSIRFRDSLTASEALLNIYYESASFILFLIDRYDMEKLRQLNRVSWLPISMLKQKVYQIYGCNLSALKNGWRQFLERYAMGQEARAEYVVQTLNDWADLIGGLLKQLALCWRTSPFLLVSPSGKVYEEYDALLGSLIKLARPRAEEAGPEAARKDYELYQSALATVKNSLATWLEAIQTFEAVLNSIPEQSDYETIIDELEEIQALYREVGDEGMVTRTGEYIAAFQLLQEGVNRLMDGNLASAENTLVNALELFSKLDEQQMARQVSRLLELSRHVIM